MTVLKIYKVIKINLFQRKTIKSAEDKRSYSL